MSRIRRQSLFDLLPQLHVSTGVSALDDKLHDGISSGSVYEILGAPASAKTSLSVSIAIQYIFQNKKVLWIDTMNVFPHEIFTKYHEYDKYSKHINFVVCPSLGHLAILLKSPKFSLDQYSLIIVHGFHNLVEMTFVNLQHIYRREQLEINRRNEEILQQNKEREIYGEPPRRIENPSKLENPLFRKKAILTNLVDTIAHHCTSNKSSCILVGSLVNKTTTQRMVSRASSSRGLSQPASLSQSCLEKIPSSADTEDLHSSLTQQPYTSYKSVLRAPIDEEYWNQCITGRIVLTKGWLRLPLKLPKVIHNAIVYSNFTTKTPDGIGRRRLARSRSIFKNKSTVTFEVYDQIPRNLEDLDLTLGKEDDSGEDYTNDVYKDDNEIASEYNDCTNEEEAITSVIGGGSGEKLVWDKERSKSTSPENEIVSVVCSSQIEGKQYNSGQRDITETSGTKEDKATLQVEKRIVDLDCYVPHKKPKTASEVNDAHLAIQNDSLGQFVEASDDDLETLS